MKTVAGIFESREDAARAAARLEALGIERDDVTVLTPGSEGHAADVLPTDEGEQPGIAKAVGAVAGAAAGASAGVQGMALVSAFVVPGLGPVIASGIIGAALFGAAGAAIGGALENNLNMGLPRDEVFVYEDALRRGGSVVVALVRDDARDAAAREALKAVGATSVDEAREQWWVGLRDVERTAWGPGEEASFRRGFEAALGRDARGRSYEEALDSLRVLYPDVAGDPAFRRGYDRGQAYQRGLIDQSRAPDLRKSA